MNAAAPRFLLLPLLLLALATAADTTVPLAPEASSGLRAKPGWAVKRFAVAAANPLAVEAGYQMLKAGGSAVDAAIAVQMVLTLVEPQSSGIGGGAFLMTWDGQAVQAWDGRESAPAAAKPTMFLRPDGKPMTVPEAIVGGLSVGTGSRANCRGPPCFNRPSSWPPRASRSARD
jgi:gamma-glutamyltranspeptidase/glutathione hydrolase